MTFFQELTQAVESYPEDHLELEIIDVSFPDNTVNANEEGSFKVSVTNRGPLILKDVSVKVRGLNGTQVKTGGAADTTWRSEFVTGTQQLEQVNAHNGNNPQVVEGSPMQFKAPSSAQPRTDLIAVTIEEWDASLDHALKAHSDPTDTPSGTFSARVFPS